MGRYWAAIQARQTKAENNWFLEHFKWAEKLYKTTIDKMLNRMEVHSISLDC